MRYRDALAWNDQGKPRSKKLKMANVKYTPVVGLADGRIMKFPGGLSHTDAMAAAEKESDRLEGEGCEVEWFGSQRATG